MCITRLYNTSACLLVASIYASSRNDKTEDASYSVLCVFDVNVRRARNVRLFSAVVRTYLSRTICRNEAITSAKSKNCPLESRLCVQVLLSESQRDKGPFVSSTVLGTHRHKELGSNEIKKLKVLLAHTGRSKYSTRTWHCLNCMYFLYVSVILFCLFLVLICYINADIVRYWMVHHSHEVVEVSFG